MPPSVAGLTGGQGVLSVAGSVPRLAEAGDSGTPATATTARTDSGHGLPFGVAGTQSGPRRDLRHV